MEVADWNIVAGSNTTIGALSIAEGTTSRADLNDAMREFMAEIARWRLLVNAARGPDIILEDQKASSFDGGTFTSGADRTRVLNTEVRDAKSDCALASNQFTLQSGTYYIEWSAPAYQVGAHQSLLYDVTGAATLKRGTTGFTINGTANSVVSSTGQHVVTIASANAYEIRHRCTTTFNTFGFGVAASFGTEIYTVVKMWRLA